MGQAPVADIANVLGMTENTADVLETTPAPVAPSESPVPSDVYAAISQVDRVRQEPEKIKVWREEQKKRLEEKDKEAEVKQAEWLVAAKHELEEWYKHSAAQFEKTKVLNRKQKLLLLKKEMKIYRDMNGK